MQRRERPAGPRDASRSAGRPPRRSPLATARPPRRGDRPAVKPAPPPAKGTSKVHKILAERGVASRRHAEELIAAGRVTSRGRPVQVGDRLGPDVPIEVDGSPAASAVTRRYVLLNKPVGVVSTARDERGRATVVSLVGARERLYPVGRLDSDSEGLLLLTNDGAWAERVLHPRFGHEREYEVDVEPGPTSAQLSALGRGVQLEEGVGELFGLKVVGNGRVRLVLRTGWKRQVRRMFAAVGLRVTRLRRVRLGPLLLGALPPGKWRELTAAEVRVLRAAGPGLAGTGRAAVKRRGNT
jgi:23S rRNA pseudouridine2605 synthase